MGLPKAVKDAVTAGKSANSVKSTGPTTNNGSKRGRPQKDQANVKAKASSSDEQWRAVFKEGKARAWWEPTTNKQRTGFSGAYWPVKLLDKVDDRFLVQYDNGEEEYMPEEHIYAADTPYGFGEEPLPLQIGEFVEVHNGSTTDPCAWLARVKKVVKQSSEYMIEYPFHDTNAEKIKMKLLRRARVEENGVWKLVKPKQTWKDGEVTCPLELELIDEEELGEYVDLSEEPAPTTTKTPSSNSKKRAADAAEAAPSGKKAAASASKTRSGKAAAAAAGASPSPAPEPAASEAKPEAKRQQEQGSGRAAAAEAVKPEAEAAGAAPAAQLTGRPTGSAKRKPKPMKAS